MAKNRLYKKSELAILSYVTRSSDNIFEIDGHSIDGGDFSSSVSTNLYKATKELCTESAQATDGSIVDRVLLEERVASNWPVDYDRYADTYRDAIEQIYSAPVPTKSAIKQHVKSVVTESYRGKILGHLEDMKGEISDSKSAHKMIENIERGTYEFTSTLFKSEDIVDLGEEYASWLNDLAKNALDSKIEKGIATGFELFDDAIGGGLRKGTINVIAARPKRHKSFLALTIAKNVALQGIPVLYLDTELSTDLQMSRMTAMMADVPLNSIESGSFVTEPENAEKIKNIMPLVEKMPLDYVQIAGWGIEQQVSVIRRWFARRVGKNAEGKWNQAVVVLDYLKLMNASDKRGEKEYEALGYMMSSLHDLMRDYDSPMLALAQQNRSGVEAEDATTISGSDRIIWLCDNFSILAKKTDAEIQASLNNVAVNPETNDSMTNMKLIVAECRHGPGTQGRYIGIYVDAKDPRVKKEQVTCRLIEKNLEMPWDEAGHGTAN